MAKYVLLYSGAGGVPETEEEQKAVMAAWTAWFTELGDSVVDGGNPFGASKTLNSDGSVSDGASSNLGGYSILAADSIESVVDKCKGSPALANGGSIQIYETFDVM